MYRIGELLFRSDPVAMPALADFFDDF